MDRKRVYSTPFNARPILQWQLLQHQRLHGLLRHICRGMVRRYSRLRPTSHEPHKKQPALITLRQDLPWANPCVANPLPCSNKPNTAQGAR